MKKTLLTAAVVTTVAGISYQANAESYEVKNGDTLWSIAKENGTSVAELKSLNKLDDNLIVAGQKLKVENKDFYIVKKDDTLKSIAKHFDVEVKDLKEWNNLSSSKLKVGKKIIVSEKGYQLSKKALKPISKVASPVKAPTIERLGDIDVSESKSSDNDVTSRSTELNNSTESNTSNESYEYNEQNNSRSNTQAKSSSNTTPVSGNVASVANGLAAGKNYVFGANSGNAVDCSAFAQQVMASMGKSIPRTTYAQMAAGTQVSDPQPGDLVFFNGGSHVGVYVGNGQMVDALNPSEGVGQRAVSYVSGSVTGYYRY